MKKVYTSAFLVFLTLAAIAQTSQWAWVSGTNTNNIQQPGVYGIKGIPAAANKPGARTAGVNWKDTAGNFWLFGGGGFAVPNSTSGELNDLWRYSPRTNQWTWMSGDSLSRRSPVWGTKGVAAPTNKPAARKGAVSWADGRGNLWLYGGTGYLSPGGSGGYFNDLWKYNTATGQWTWVSGDSLLNQFGFFGVKNIATSATKPGSRMEAMSWADPAGNLWLFGGYGFVRPSGGQTIGGAEVGDINDLWKYNIASNQWTWVSGDSVRFSVGIYGTKGQPAPTNRPGGRQSSVAWRDATGNLWLYGGYGYATAFTLINQLSDLWKFSATTLEWTWVGGTNTILAPPVYGTKGVPSPTAFPGGRSEAFAWTDDGNTFWFFGGQSTPGTYNDLWRYDVATAEWTWVSGDNVPNQGGIYQTKAVADPAVKPGAREGIMGWKDADGNLWLFGGFGFATSVMNSYLNDLWKYTLGTPNLSSPLTFSATGKITTELGGLADDAQALKFQPDGKFVTAGTGGGLNFSVARYNADGSLDNSFHGNGKVITVIATDVESRVFDLAIQADGKILVAGVLYNGNGFNLDFALVRYNPDGSLDNGFGSNGIVITDFSGGREDQIQSVLLQPDGRIVVAGWSFNGTDYDFVLARYMPNGNLDPGFGNAGKVVTDFAGRDDKAYAVALQSDGKIVVGGESDNGTNNDFALARYTSVGLLDTGFDGDGLVVTDMNGQDHLTSILIQADGNIVAAGAEDASLFTAGRTTGDAPNGNLALARYTPNGSLDNRFGQNGKVSTDLGSYADVATDVTLQSDGKLVVAGQNGDNGDFTVLRYLNNGNLDPTFFGTESRSIDFNNRPDFPHAIEISSENIYVAGRTSGAAGDDFALARINASTGSPLPLKLSQITATKLGAREVDVKWKTTAEEGASYFDVERSENGVGFTKIGQVPARGTNGGSQSYSLIDRHASATNHYRLNVVNVNGQNQYSPTVFIRLATDKEKVGLYPNPVTDKLQVQSSLKGQWQITVQDAAGRRVKQATVTPQNGTTVLHLGSLPEGSYLLTVRAEEQSLTAKFFKK